MHLHWWIAISIYIEHTQVPIRTGDEVRAITVKDQGARCDAVFLLADERICRDSAMIVCKGVVQVQRVIL